MLLIILLPVRVKQEFIWFEIQFQATRFTVCLEQDISFQGSFPHAIDFLAAKS